MDSPKLDHLFFEAHFPAQHSCDINTFYWNTQKNKIFFFNQNFFFLIFAATVVLQLSVEGV